MITLHHLAFSRSLRVLWLLEELGIEYDLVKYARTEAFRAPATLAQVHPLGTSPTIVDGDLVMAESSAILRYIDERYGHGTLTPPAGTKAHALHSEWLDYVEGSAARPLLTLLRAKMQHHPDLIAAALPDVHKTMNYIEHGIGAGPWLMGPDLTLADMQMSYLLAIAQAAGALADYPGATDYLNRVLAHPSFVKATAVGGPMLPPNLAG